ncbi:MAG: tripartite tricarboxylate transporter substrate binding protein [Betaproteobacteria bacterium]|nr:tripartite tricarboxylate transporter substrate binding protein [Betaproteobacteria bacterium]
MSRFQRNSLHLPGLLSGLLAPLIAGSAVAQSSYPEKPVRIIVGSPPGSTQDTVARLLAQKFSETFGRPVVAENLAGAAGAIGVERVARAAPDGYTLGLLAQGQLTVNPGLYKVSYDTMKDFAPVSEASATLNMVVVHNAVPAKSIKELVALAKAQPGVLTYASGGNGSASHLPAELFKSMAGVNILHVPYKGVSAALPDLVGGRVTMSFIPTSPVLALVREGKLRGLAVTSPTRLQSMPDLPTVAESGYPGYEFTAWQGLLAPANTPTEIIGRLHLETVKALALPDVRAKFAALGMEAVGNSPAEFAAVIKSDLAKWTKVIKEAGIKAD